MILHLKLSQGLGYSDANIESSLKQGFQITTNINILC